MNIKEENGRIYEAASGAHETAVGASGAASTAREATSGANETVSSATGNAKAAMSGAGSAQGQTLASPRLTTAKLAKLAMVVAISVVLSFIHFPILPTAPFLEFEMSDLSILVGGFVFGPGYGLVICGASILLHDLIIGPASGPYGMVMHLLAAGIFVLVSAFIYKKNKTRKGALISLIVGGLSMVVLMVPANLIITPLFLTLPIDAVKAMILPAILPFNLLKAALNTVVVFFLYKRVSRFLHKW